MARPKKNTTPIDVEGEVTSSEPTPQKRRPVQTEIPGTNRVNIPAIDEASENFVNIRDEFKSVTQRLIDSKKILSALMHKHAEEIGPDANGGLTYRYGDMAVIIERTEEKLKVKHVDADEVVVGGAPADASEGE